MATRIPYLNEWTVSYGIRNSSGTLVQPTTITLHVADGSGSTVTLANAPAWDATTLTTIQTFTDSEIEASAYATRWTLTWSGNADGTDFTDVEYAYIVKPNQELWHTTVYEVKKPLGIVDATDDDLVAFLIESAQDALEQMYGLPTVPKTTEARYVTVRDSTFVPLEECNSVTSITDESGTSVDATEYTVVFGRTASGHRVKGVILEWAYSGQLTVTGSWGFDNTPADIGRALMLTVSTWYKRAKLGDANDVIGNFSALPRETREILDARVLASI